MVLTVLFIYGHTMRLAAGSSFPDQGLNPGRQSESLEHYPRVCQGIPSFTHLKGFFLLYAKPHILCSA